MKVLLALSSTRDREEEIQRLLESLGPNDELVLLFVLDRRIPESVASWLLYLGFMGEALTDEIQEVIFGELTRNAEDRLQEIRDRAQKRGIRVKAVLREGNFFDALKELYEAERPDRVVFFREEGVLLSEPQATPSLPFPYEEL